MDEPHQQAYPEASLPSLQQRAATLAPLHQGELDGLCGLYAAINALRLLLVADRPLTKAEVRGLFATGVRVLVKRERLASAVTSGIPQGTWRKLVTRLAAAAGDMVGRRVVVMRPLEGRGRVSRQELFEVLERATDKGQPVIVSLSGQHDHYATVCGYTARRLVLFDSGALSWLARANCAPTTSRPERLHRIDAGSMIALKVLPSVKAKFTRSIIAIADR